MSTKSWLNLLDIEKIILVYSFAISLCFAMGLDLAVRGREARCAGVGSRRV